MIYVPLVDGAAASWCTVSGNNLQFNTSNVALKGTYTITLLARATNVNPVSDSAIITFKVLMYGSRCLDTAMTIQTVPTMNYEIGGLSGFTDQLLNGFTDTITQGGTENCGPRQYVVTGPAITNGTLVLSYVDATTSKLRLTTTNPTYLGTTSIKIVANLLNHPFLNGITKVNPDSAVPYITVETTFSVVITGKCQTTSFIKNQYLTASKLHIVDTNPISWNFLVTQESVGNSVAAANTSILPEATCLGRVYTIQSVINENGIQIDPKAVSVNSPTMRLTLNGASAKYAGVHIVTVGVKLAEYPTVARYDQTFKVYISPSCRTSTFSTTGIQLKDMDNISIKEGKVKQKLPLITSDVATDINKKWAFGKGLCGSTRYSIKMQDENLRLPDFIKIENITDTENNEFRYVTVNPTNETEVGQYKVQTEYTLETYAFYATPKIEKFEINVISVPEALNNRLPTVIEKP